MCGDVDELVDGWQDAHGGVERGRRGEVCAGNERVGGVEAVVEEAPMEVELEALGGVREGEILPEGDEGRDTRGGEAAAWIGARIAGLGEQIDLTLEIGRRGEDVYVADVAGVGAAEEELRKRDAFEDGELEAGLREGLREAMDGLGGAQGLKGVGAGLKLQSFTHRGGQGGGTDAVQRGEAEWAELVVSGNGEKFIPVEQGRGQGFDALDFPCGVLGTGAEEHELHVLGEVAECQQGPPVEWLERPCKYTAGLW